MLISSYTEAIIRRRNFTRLKQWKHFSRQGGCCLVSLVSLLGNT